MSLLEAVGKCGLGIGGKNRHTGLKRLICSQVASIKLWAAVWAPAIGSRAAGGKDYKP